MTFRGGGGYPCDVIVQKCMHKPTFLMKIVTLRRGREGFQLNVKMTLSVQTQFAPLIQRVNDDRIDSHSLVHLSVEELASTNSKDYS